jgi:hypothetical protein
VCIMSGMTCAVSSQPLERTLKFNCGHLVSEMCWRAHLYSLPQGAEVVCPTCKKPINSVSCVDKLLKGRRVNFAFQRARYTLVCAPFSPPSSSSSSSSSSDPTAASTEGASESEMVFLTASRVFRVPLQRLKLVCKGKVYASGKAGKSGEENGEGLVALLDADPMSTLYVVGMPEQDKSAPEKAKEAAAAARAEKKEQREAQRAVLKAEARHEFLAQQQKWVDEETKKVQQQKSKRPTAAPKRENPCSSVLSLISRAGSAAGRSPVGSFCSTTWLLLSSFLIPQEDPQIAIDREEEKNRWNPQANRPMGRVKNGKPAAKHDVPMGMGGG